jgi:2-polyprenyl-3-methyl-5-hydroxy-6-metoxy-1,4-benzoquinol methylase
MENAPKSCILCDTCERELLIERDCWKIYRCTSCGLGILDPRPTKEELKGLYGREYFATQYDEGADPESPEFKKWLSLLEHRVRFFRNKKRKGRLLDIGCGNGYFLALCRSKGYDVQGIDISQWVAKYATQRLGLDVRIGEIDDVDLPLQYFDIITMWHTLEHTPDPRRAMEKVRNWLKEDGILVVEVPNYEGTDARSYWQDWVGWQFPFHFFHFTPKTLRRLLAGCGFRVVRTKNYHSEKVKQTLKRIPVVSILARLISKIYSGHSIAVIAQLDEPMVTS